MRRLTILVTSTIGWGHVNACCGALSPLLRRGHRLVYVTREAFRPHLLSLGFEVFIYGTSKPRSGGACASASAQFASDLLDWRLVGRSTPRENLRHTIRYLDGASRLADLYEQDVAVRKALSLYAPDLIYYDANALLPSVYYSGRPWVRHLSTAPQYYFLDSTGTVPPGGSSFPSSGDTSAWPAFNGLRSGLFTSSPFNDAIEAWGYPRFPGDARCPASPYLTVINYPEELMYEAIRQSGWLNLEVANKAPLREASLANLVPSSFLNDSLDGRWSGKLVYVSMGSLVSVDLPLMERLVAILTQTPHKYIIAKGQHSAELSLGRNLWGGPFLPQLSLLRAVHLVISHGGNNTVTETFAAGVPLLVLPNFMDQFDNGQRLAELGFGRTLNAYDATETEIISAIDQLLADETLHGRLKDAAGRIQATDGHETLARTLERIAEQREEKGGA